MIYAILFVVSAVLAYFLSPSCAKFAVSIGAVDIPKDARKIHKKPMPYGGGIAMFLAFFVVLSFAYLHPDVNRVLHLSMWKYFGLLASSSLVLMVGLFDDIRPIRARYKFLVHLVAAMILVAVGFRITHLSHFFSVGETIYLEIWAYPISILWIAGVINTMNLIDGLDGLSAGIAAIASTTILAIALITGNTNTAMMATMLAGVCIGFLPRNFNPAKMFMGDAGAYFIGLVLAVISMEGGLKSATVLTLVVPLLAVGIPVFDTAFAMIRRYRNGKSIGEPDRGHIHHRFMDFGLDQKRAVITMYLINVLFGLSAVALINGDWQYALILVVVGFFMMFIPSLQVEGSGPKIACGHIAPRTDKPRILAVFGTRPEVTKMAPLVNVLKRYETMETLVCVTGQHREQLDQALAAFNLKPDIDLDLMKQGQTLTDVTVRTMERVDNVIQQLKPDMVMVHGDPSASFTTALTTFYHNIPIAHVEAGLRSGNIHSPFPEEFNRRATGMIADLHFAATEFNRQTLLSEGVPSSKIYVTGNTSIDAVHSVVRKDYQFEEPILTTLKESDRIIVMTAHRRENLGDRMRSIFRAMRRIADEYQDVQLVYAVHLNPKVREVAQEILSGHSRIHLVNPLGYADMCNLMNQCYMVVTDSGGLQEEAPALDKPVVVLRVETERTEALEAGTVLLAGVEEESVYQNVKSLLDDHTLYAKMANAENPYGDGHTSERIAEILNEYFSEWRRGE